MNSEEIYKVIKKLLGEIEPYGDANIDEKRMRNLNNTIKLTYLLLRDIEDVARYKNRVEHSIKLMSSKASYFLKTLHQEFELSQED